MRIRIRDECVALLPERAMFWPTHSLLVVADCHLGKAETFQQQGFWLPSQSGQQDLTRLCARAQCWRTARPVLGRPGPFVERGD
ncbi:MAG: hypothetical protein U0319_01235 [Nitrospira sp.]